MLYRHLCDAIPKASVLGYGAAGLGGVYNAIDADMARRIIETCLEEGVNYFDTAPFVSRSCLVAGPAVVELCLGLRWWPLPHFRLRLPNYFPLTIPIRASSFACLIVLLDDVVWRYDQRSQAGGSAGGYGCGEGELCCRHKDG